MPLSGTETFGTVVPGFVTDEDGALVLSGLPSPYEHYVANTIGTEIFLPLGNNDGLVDRSGNGRNGTAFGGITIGGSSPGPLAVADEAATDFDGTNDRISTTYSPYANGQILTFMGWAWRDTNSSTDCLFSSDATFASNLWPVCQLAAGTQDIVFRPKQTAGLVATWSAAWPGNEAWVHWALVQNQPTGALSLYINGALVSTQTVAGSYDATPGNLMIGRASASEVHPFDGKMAWFSITARALTPEEIATAHGFGTA